MGLFRTTGRWLFAFPRRLWREFDYYWPFHLANLIVGLLLIWCGYQLVRQIEIGGHHYELERVFVSDTLKQHQLISPPIIIGDSGGTMSISIGVDSSRGNETVKVNYALSFDSITWSDPEHNSFIHDRLSTNSRHIYSVKVVPACYIKFFIELPRSRFEENDVVLLSLDFFKIM